MALLMGYPLSDDLFGAPFSNYYFWATTGTLLIIVVYIMLCLGGIVYFRNTRDTRNWNPLLHVVVPIIGAIVFGAALYGSIHPTPPGILKYTPYVALVWLVIGLGVLVYAAQHPAGQGRPDRLHPGRGGRHRRRDPGPLTRRHQREDGHRRLHAGAMAHPRVRREPKDPARGRSGGSRTMAG